MMPRLSSRTLLALFLLLVSPLLVAPVAAQSGDAAPQPELFAESVDVRVVNLEIVVEQKGERVHGLTPDEFVLRVDGERVPIEFFTEVHGGTAVAPGGGDESTVPALAPGEDLGTRYLVFVDDVFSMPHHRNRVLRQLESDLALLGPNDSLAMVAWNGRSLDLLTSWAESPRELEAAFREARDRPTRGLHFRSIERLQEDFRYGGRAFGPRTAGFYDGTGPYGTTVGPGSWAYAEAREVIDAAASTLRAFARPDGRKVLLLLSGSWPPSVVDTWDERDVGVRTGPPRIWDVFSPLIDTANLLGYTVYPVDVPGMEANFADASIGSIRRGDYVRNVRRDREFHRESALVELADQTGGRALLDGAAGSALERVHEDTRSFYWIGFTPNWQANDRRHRVDVEVPGLRRAKVRLRESFSDLSPSTEATLRLESAQLFDFPVAGAGRLAASFGEPRSAGWNKVVVPLEVEVPLDRITLLPTADGWATQLQLRVAVTDDRGERANIPVIPVVLEGRGQPAPGLTRTFVTELKMRERPHRVVVSLVDTAAGEELTTRLSVDPEA